jgi:hypothetical protein
MRYASFKIRYVEEPSTNKKIENFAAVDINSSMNVDSVAKIINKVVIDVIQKNPYEAMSALYNAFSMKISNSQCDDIVITGIAPGFRDPNSESKIREANRLKIITEISNSINKIVSNDLQIDNTKVLDLDDIKNSIDKNDFNMCDLTCEMVNAFNKARELDKAKAEGRQLTPAKRARLEITDIEMKAITQLYATCIFDQKKVNELANKIINKLKNTVRPACPKQQKCPKCAACPKQQECPKCAACPICSADDDEDY